MAIVSEIWSSRDGTSSGPSGSTAPRRFFVDLENDDLPTNWAQLSEREREIRHPDPRTYVRDLAAPFNSNHPWERHAVAVAYTLERRETLRRFIVRVDYSLPTDAISGGPGVVPGWEFAFDGSAREEELLTELEDETARTFEMPRIIGPNSYRIAEDDETPTHFAQFSADNQVSLIQEESRQEVGYRRLIPQVNMSLTRDILTFDLTRIGMLTAHLGTANKGKFYGAGVGQVLFTSFSVRSSPSPVQDTSPRARGPTAIHKVTLNFLFSQVAHTPFRLVHRWPHPELKDAVAFVRDANTGQVVEEGFRVAHVRALDAMMRNVQS